MQILGFLVAAYGAALATYLGYLTYRRERHRVRLRFRLEAGDGPPGLAVYVVNLGIRAVTIRDGYFFWNDDDGRFGPSLRHNGQLPVRLDDGDELRLWISINEVFGSPDGFLVEDTTGREHHQQFSAPFMEQLVIFRQWLDEARSIAG
jgi:hypothetical protein